MRWLNRQSPHPDEQGVEEKQSPTQPAVIVIIHESWTLRWADESEAPPLPKATE
jgi:hypothetical protein